MANQSNRLLVVWSSGKIEVAKKMVFMYTRNSMIHGWWEEVTLLIWGASARLLVDTADLQEELNLLREAGVKLIACKSCAEKLGVVPQLEALGVDVFYTGEFFTNWIKSDDKYITF